MVGLKLKKNLIFMSVRVLEGKQREDWAEKGFPEIIAGNLPSLTRDINTHIQEAKDTPNSINTKKSMLTYIIVKPLKTIKIRK